HKVPGSIPGNNKAKQNSGNQQPEDDTIRHYKIHFSGYLFLKKYNRKEVRNTKECVRFTWCSPVLFYIIYWMLGKCWML
ncbi:hypothetical protein ACQP3J_33325, partial [Escherichia coli]